MMIHSKDPIQLGSGYVLDTHQEVLTQGKSQLTFSRTEFRILYLLALNLGKIVPAEELITFAWGSPHVGDSTLYVYISRLRKKLITVYPHPTIISQRNVGYVLYPMFKPSTPTS
ncbi:winged helix-turn-helix domain-containing protein [Mechercharimyces sp. CAU 1602]|uniref:winged helix-turn-helix domain-containing protein n=1 Tax=Mechercharimyces sp. CAU 1602 TaxID=2973933 RepID=UPI0021639001|nr:winged helix-turn-helix domain-containing protein [Mechercharimyces sp. CAU 1602]MCS1352487.1 winged helix-turn-helix domain-containing protein [Mechercharimyces sp. CAU 1602]